MTTKKITSFYIKNAKRILTDDVRDDLWYRKLRVARNRASIPEGTYTQGVYRPIDLISQADITPGHPINQAHRDKPKGWSWSRPGLNRHRASWTNQHQWAPHHL